MIYGRDIIIVSQQAWDVDIGSNCKNIALEFSKKNRVLYVNPPLDRITKIRRRYDKKVIARVNVIRKRENGLIRINENLWTYYPDVMIESINWIRYTRLFSVFNKRNNLRLARSVEPVLRQLEFSNYLLFNDSDMFRSYHLKELLAPHITIYYSRDNMIATKYWMRHGKKIEPSLIKKSDLCFANSEFLRSYCAGSNSNSFYVGQGCDFELTMDTSKYRKPKSMMNITSPIVGYVGALTSDRLDIRLMEEIASFHESWSLVLVGPQDAAFKSSNLHSFKNVYFLGAKDPKELPMYISTFDVCINPQSLNELTIGNYPRKIDEYLVAGKPVVATKTDTMLSFRDHVMLAASAEEFITMIQYALENDSKEHQRARKKFALSHTWENSVAAMCLHITEYEDRLKKDS